MDDLVYYLASIIAVLCVLVPHEFAHAFVAYKCGDGTAKFQGRMTLNPVKHFDPAGFVLCVLTGFGWAKPVPIYPSNFRNYRKGLFLTAIAGVVANYIIAFLAYPLFLLIAQFLVPTSDVGYYLVYFAKYTFLLIFIYSLSIFIFNLLPLYPLDGFRVIESFTRQVNPVRRFLKNYGQYILIGLVIESFACNLLSRYAGLEWAQYCNILYYIQTFARKIIGFPITALWNVVFGLPYNFSYALGIL